jgi:D-glycero-alpha-D-manno-heptose-7-phosphate kinase
MVGALNTLYAYRGRYTPVRELAEKACDIELDLLCEPIGKQDQYAAAFGGLRRYLFNTDGTVQVDPVICASRRRQDFFDHIMLFYLGGERSASSVLKGITDQTGHLARLRSLVDDFWDILTGPGDLRALGDILHEGWENKKQMGGITTSQVDECYDAARRAGALGGKLLGAGQAGFLMLFVEPKKKLAIRESLWYTPHNPREVQFGYEPEGSKIVYVS